MKTCGGFKKGHDDRMSLPGLGRELRLEKRCDKKPLVGKLHGAGFARGPSRRNSQPSARKPGFEFGVYFIIAEILPMNFIPAANGTKLCIGLHSNGPIARKFRGSRRAVGDSTHNRGDDDIP